MEDTYFKFLRRTSREVKRAQRMETIKEIVGAIVLVGVALAFCALCVLGSGYSWE